MSKCRKTAIVIIGILLVVAVIIACFFGLTTKESRILMRSELLESISTDTLYQMGISVPDENVRVAFYRKMTVFKGDEKKLEKIKGEKLEIRYPFEKNVYSFGDNRQFLVLETNGNFSLFEFQNYYYSLDPAVLNLTEEALDGYSFGEVPFGYVFSEVYGIGSSEDISRIVVSEREDSSRVTLRKSEKDEAYNLLCGITLGKYSSFESETERDDTCKITVHYGKNERFSVYFNGTAGSVFYDSDNPKEGNILSAEDTETMRQMFLSEK